MCNKLIVIRLNLFMQIGTILQWSYTYNLVRISLTSKEKSMIAQGAETTFQQESGNLLPHSIADKASTSSFILSARHLEESTPLLNPDRCNNKEKVAYLSFIFFIIFFLT